MSDSNDEMQDEGENQMPNFLFYRFYIYNVPENTFDFRLTDDLRFARSIPELGIFRGDYLFKVHTILRKLCHVVGISSAFIIHLAFWN